MIDTTIHVKWEQRGDDIFVRFIRGDGDVDINGRRWSAHSECWMTPEEWQAEQDEMRP